MTKSKHIILRRTDERQSQLDELAALIGKSGPTAAIDFALSFTLAQYRTRPAPQPGGRVGERGGEMIEQVCPICGTKLQTAGDYPLTFCPVCDTITDEEAKQLQNMTIEEYEAYFAAKQEAQA